MLALLDMRARVSKGDTGPQERLSAPAEPPDSTLSLRSTVDLRNATSTDRRARKRDLGESDLGSSSTAFAELVAVMRVTGYSLDAEILRALIARLAYLLGEPVPADL
jgi:hypothetical protein